MMMFSFFMFLLLIWTSHYQKIIYIYSMITILLLLKLKEFTNTFVSLNSMFYFDFFSWSLLILTLMISSLSWMAMNYFSSNKKSQNFYISTLTFTLIFSFMVKTPLYFYFWFESSLIPIFLLILGWGYQPERLFASKSMFLYTIFASLPLLSVLIFYHQELSLTNFHHFKELFFFFEKSNWLSFLMVMSTLSFLTKFPMYTMHLWLPKAHVEAPVSGSMILAGILLKLGGYGIFRMSWTLNFMNYFSYFILFFSMMGGAWISIICIAQNDMKVLIAYSSVSHMSLAIAGLLTKTKLLSAGALGMLLCHGSSSAAMFLGASILYLRSFSRNMLINKGTLMIMPLFSSLWAFICVSNMAGPPSFNLFSELILFIGLMSFWKMAWLPLSVMAFFSAAYSLILYASLQHGKPAHPLKSFLSLNFPELLILTSFMIMTFFTFLFILPLMI